MIKKELNLNDKARKCSPCLLQGEGKGGWRKVWFTRARKGKSHTPHTPRGGGVYNIQCFNALRGHDLVYVAGVCGCMRHTSHTSLGYIECICRPQSHTPAYTRIHPSHTPRNKQYVRGIIGWCMRCMRKSASRAYEIRWKGHGNGQGWTESRAGPRLALRFPTLSPARWESFHDGRGKFSRQQRKAFANAGEGGGKRTNGVGRALFEHESHKAKTFSRIKATTAYK